jgi:ABC-type transport system substrate-binding protein
MKRRQFVALAGAAGIGPALLPTARAMAQAAARGTITFGQSTSIVTLDPAFGAFTNYPGGYEAALCLYDRLLDFDADMKIVPGLASAFQMAPDLTSITLTLRPGVVFHDGTPLDVAAVKFNIERMMDKVRNPTNRPLWDPVSAVETPDATTIVIRTKVPYAQLPNTLAHAAGSLVSPAQVAKVGEKGFAQAPAGAGPYQVESFKPGTELVLKAFDRYWGSKPGADKLVFQFIAESATRVSALRTAAVDVIDSVPVQLAETLRRDPKLDLLRKPGLRPMGFAFNLTRASLADLRVRQAINLAVPVEVIARKIFFGYAKAPDSPLAFDTIGHATVGRTIHDPNKAAHLLTEAGWKPGKDGMREKDGVPLKLDLFTPDGLFPGDMAVAEITAASLKQIGVDVQISKIEKGAYWDQLRQDRAHLTWDLAMFGFNPSNASGLYHLQSLFKSNTDDAGRPDVWNVGRYRNPDVDAALAKANADPDQTVRDAALAEAQKLIWQDTPYLWLQVNENVSAIRKPVTGVEVWPIVFTVLRRAHV